MLLILNLLSKLADFSFFVKDLGSGLILNLTSNVGLIRFSWCKFFTQLKLLTLKLLYEIFFVLNIYFEIIYSSS